MRNVKGWLVGAALVALATAVIAQPVAQNNVSGNECWNAGQGPGGPSSFLCINLVRNGTAMALITGSGAATTIATQQQQVLMWNGAAPTTWTVTLPNPAFDGELLTLGTNTTLTTMVTAQTTNTPQVQVALSPAYSAQTLTAGTSVMWQFNFASLTWFRVR
ncbi:MAG TPA: hypothetical protein VH187_05545 [Scandinavium sp.]|jgi:hypothetical protein|uniref:hypothetical protein n=1 Tax=Scandinavium sp. TaxID=2830653 RepID=UPI002E2FFEEB|nr:hypothetical protein [Scandinavium sp.]HEX4500625.1 hypothetical protein [Scandinavium sp.]